MNPDIRVGGSWHSITRSEVYLGGSWRTLTRGEIYKGGAWHALFTFIVPFSASASPSEANGIGSSIHPITITSNIVTITPTGGLGPYTYSWAGGGATPSGPVNATTSFSYTVGQANTFSTTANCTVTDSLGSVVVVPVPVFLENTG